MNIVIRHHVLSSKHIALAVLYRALDCAWLHLVLVQLSIIASYQQPVSNRIAAINECTIVQNPPRHVFMPLWTDLAWRHNHGNSRNSTHETQLTKTSTQAAYRVRVVKYACALSAGKWPTIGMAFNGGVLDLCNGEVSEKTPQIF